MDRAFVECALNEPYDTSEKNVCNRIEKIEQLLLTHYASDPSEHAVMLCMNNQLDVFDVCRIADGSIHSARFHSRDAVRTFVFFSDRGRPLIRHLRFCRE